jgi:hypothetical protein
MRDKFHEFMIYAYLCVVYGLIEPTKDFVRMCWTSFVKGMKAALKIDI